MGDMAEAFREADLHFAEVRRKRKIRAHAILENRGVRPDKIDQSGSFIFSTPIGTVVYYPTKGTWLHKSKLRRGGAKRFCDWIQKVRESGEETP